MDGVCRLCCSGAGVTHEIFDEQKSTYLKLSTCLPVKVVKDDQLPQKICNRCSGRLDDYYQFCSEAIASQARLRESISVYAPDKLVLDYTDTFDLSKVKQVDSPATKPHLEQLPIQLETKCTQTEEPADIKVNVKLEKTLLQIKTESVKSDEENPALDLEDFDADYVPSDYSEDISLKSLKKKKKKLKKEKLKGEKLNGDVKKRKRRRKDDFTNGVVAKNENEDVNVIDSKPAVSFEPEVSLQGSNGLQIKQEWMNINFEPALLDAVASQYLDATLIKTENFLDESWHCCVCFMQCPNKNDMIAHYRSRRSDVQMDRQLVRNPKNVVMSWRYDFRSHVNAEDLKLEPECKLDVITEEEENPSSYKCKLCDKVFNRKYTLEKHALVHEDRRPYRCSLCEKTFREVNQILKHGRTHTYETPQTTPVAECVIDDCPTALKGELCPDEHLVVRPRTHPQPLSKRFVCDLCDEGFVYMRYLIEHRNRTHPEASSRKFVNRCMHCSREFAHLNSLRRHLRSHTGERNFLCNVCGKALSSREHLKFHIRIHTGYKPNVCKTCGKGFVKKCNLTLHERVHSGEKPHVCSHCGKAFSQRSTLVIHERYHSGARPYVCTLCGKGFVAKGLLSMHLKTTCI